MMRDHDIHREKRRIWDKAFSTKALQNYEPLLLKHYAKFLNILTEHSTTGEHLNVQKSLEYLGFDITSDLTFGEPWNMLETGEPVPVVKEFLDYKKVVGHIILVNWMLHVFKIVPGVESAIFHWTREYSSALERRKKVLLLKLSCLHFQIADLIR